MTLRYGIVPMADVRDLGWGSFRMSPRDHHASFWLVHGTIELNELNCIALHYRPLSKQITLPYELLGVKHQPTRA